MRITVRCLLLPLAAFVLTAKMVLANPPAPVQLDLADGLNYDGYITQAEVTEADSYDPPGDWDQPDKLSSRMVGAVFGDHRFAQWSYGNHNFIWQQDLTENDIGLPEDGIIVAGDWEYHLVTELDAEPVGGWGNPEYPAPTSPVGLMPTVPNVIYIRRVHAETDPETAYASVTLPAAQQQTYESINLLMFGNSGAGRFVEISAVYADAPEEPELVWLGQLPNPSGVLDSDTYPTHDDLAVAFTTDRIWSNSGSPSRNTMSSQTARIYHFVDGLALDSERVLTGLTFHLEPRRYAAADFVVMAATAIPYEEDSGNDDDPGNGDDDPPFSDDDDPDPDPWLIYHDPFEDGDYTNPEDENGLTWEIIEGRAIVEASAGSLRLGLYNGTNLVVTQQHISENNFTVAFDARITWGHAGHFVFLYRDPANYYYLGVAAKNRGVYRVMDGVETRIYSDPNSYLALPHASSGLGSYKIHVRNNGTSIRLRLDLDGDFRDYDAEVIDDDPAAAALFQNTRIGVGSATEHSNSRSCHFDNVTIYGGFLQHPRDPMILHVNTATGDDARTYEEAQDPTTPWQTIQRAADEVKSGDTVMIAPGVYYEMVSPVYSGKAATPITYRAVDPANRPIIDGAAPIASSGWQPDTITTHDGRTINVVRHPYSAELVALFQGERRMFEAAEPNQEDADDPYDTNFYLPVPEEFNPGTEVAFLIDPFFFVQPDLDYWVGATLLHYDGYHNRVEGRTIVAYDPAAHKVTVNPPFGRPVGPDNGRPDKYALRGLPCLIDMPGEFALDTSTEPPSIVIWPFPMSGPETIVTSLIDHGFKIASGTTGITIDGMIIRQQVDHSITVGGRSSDIMIRNSYIHHSLNSGFNTRDSANITISNCVIAACHDNAASFGAGRNYAVIDSEIVRNGNNGIWVGTGGSTLFNTIGVTIRGNHIHHQGGHRSHADNFQMHQCDDVLIENNIMEQAGNEQNGWCQYTGNLIMRNNIIRGGSFGINSAMYTEIYHNAFFDMTLRYDQHLTNHPQHGNYYRPRSAILRNNIFIDCGLSWPSANVVDRFEAFTIDHNYYASGNSYTMLGWDWRGYHAGVFKGGSIFVSDQRVAAAGQLFNCTGRVTWGDKSRLVVLYKDPDNYYSIGIAPATRGVFRMLNGVETQLYNDSAQHINLPHASGATGAFAIAAANDGHSITLNIGRDQEPGVYQVNLVDNDPAAVAKFSGTTACGMLTVGDEPGTSASSHIADVVMQDSVNTYRDNFDDADFTTAEGPDGMTWTATVGGAAVTVVGNCRGIGFGEGSIVVRDRDLTAAQFVLAPSSEADSPYDLHLLPDSDLRDAGVFVGIKIDLDGLPRPMGAAVDIGPYEFPDELPEDPATVDSDGNGLPDIWEMEHFGMIGVDPHADPDGDGFTNLEEYIAGTDPLSAESCFTITICRTNGDDGIDLAWTAAAGRLYSIETTASLTEPDWQVIPGLDQMAGVPPVNQLQLPTTQDDGRFYRIRVRLAPGK